MKDYKNWKQQYYYYHDIFSCLDDKSNWRTLPPIAIGGQGSQIPRGKELQSCRVLQLLKCSQNKYTVDVMGHSISEDECVHYNQTPRNGQKASRLSFYFLHLRLSTKISLT